MPQITGKAVIRVDGEEWRTEDGAKLNPGGVTREAKVGGGKVHGFAEKTKEPELECSVYHTRDTDLTAINAIRDATVVYESDTGDRYVLRSAFVTEQGRVSISLIQRRFKIGFNRAANMVEQLEADGIIGPADGSKPRAVVK